MFRSILSTFGRVLVVLLVAGVVVGAAYAFSPSTASAATFPGGDNQSLGNLPSSGAVHAVNRPERGFDGGGDDAGRGASLAGVFTVAKDTLILGFIIAAVWLFRKVNWPRRAAAVGETPDA
jgi:hypothetical protein